MLVSLEEINCFRSPTRKHRAKRKQKFYAKLHAMYRNVVSAMASNIGRSTLVLYNNSAKTFTPLAFMFFFSLFDDSKY